MSSRNFVYNKERGLFEVDDAEIPQYIKSEKNLVWMDISSDIKKYLEILRSTFNLHPLTIEDMSHVRMYPKAEEYDEYLFLILHEIILLEKDNEERIKTYELFLIIGKNFVITARQHRIRAVELLQGEDVLLAHYFERGTEVVAHAIVRRLVDNYFPMLDRIEAKLDAAEDSIFNSPTSKDMENIFILRKDFVKLRSITAQQLDVINRVALGEFGIISQPGTMLARDIYDHLYRVSEKVVGFRESTMALLDAYLSKMSNNLNQIIRVLTVIATIILPLGIVVGFYGMNFKTMPGLSHPHGWLFTLGGMTLLVTAMLGFFKFKKWL